MTVEPYNITPIKLADPTEQYGNALKNAYLFNQIQEAKQKRTDVEDSQKGYDSAIDETGNFNALKGALGLKKMGRADLVLPLMQKDAEIKKINADAGKAGAEMSKAKMEVLSKKLDAFQKEWTGVSLTDPQVGQDQAFAHHKSMIADDDYKEWITKRYGSTDNWMHDRISEMMPAAQSPDTWRLYVTGEGASMSKASDQLKNTLTTVPHGDGVSLVATDPYSSNPTPHTVGEYAMGKNPNKGLTVNVNNNPEGKGLSVFNEEAAKDAIKDYRTKRSGAESAAMGVQNIDQMSKLLNDGVFVGALGKPQEDVTRYAKALGFNVNDGMIVRSQELRKMLSKNVYDQVAALKAAGVPLSRLTNAELKLVQEASPGMDMDPKTIQELLSAQRKMQQNLVIAHNQRYMEMTADPRTGDTMRLYGYHPIDIPGIPPSAIQALRQHPEKAAGFDKAFGLPAGAARGMIEGPRQPSGGGMPNSNTPFNAPGPGGIYKTSLGEITYNPNGGVDQWMGLVNKIAPTYGVDPELVRLIMDKESSGNPNAHNGANKNKSWDHGLMQVNSVHGFNTDQLSDPEFNIRQGISILAGSLKANKGNLRAGIKGYNGSGPDADRYAADILSRYRGNGYTR